MSTVYKPCEGCPFSEGTRFISNSDCEGPIRFVNQPENIEPLTGRVRGPTQGYSVGQIACSREYDGNTPLYDRELQRTYSELRGVAEDETLIQMAGHAWDKLELGFSLLTEATRDSVQPEVERAKGSINKAVSDVQDIIPYDNSFRGVVKSLVTTLYQGGIVTVDPVKFRAYKDKAASIRSSPAVIKGVTIGNVARELQIVQDNCLEAGQTLTQLQDIAGERNTLIDAVVGNDLDYHKRQLFNESGMVGAIAGDGIEKIGNAIHALQEIRL